MCKLTYHINERENLLTEFPIFWSFKYFVNTRTCEYVLVCPRYGTWSTSSSILSWARWGWGAKHSSSHIDSRQLSQFSNWRGNAYFLIGNCVLEVSVSSSRVLHRATILMLLTHSQLYIPGLFTLFFSSNLRAGYKRELLNFLQVTRSCPKRHLAFWKIEECFAPYSSITLQPEAKSALRVISLLSMVSIFKTLVRLI